MEADRDAVDVVRPCQWSDWRIRQPSGSSCARARRTWCSARGPAPARAASRNQWRARRPIDDRGQEQKTADLGHTRQPGKEGEHDRRGAHRRGDAGVGQAPVLLLAGVAQHPRSQVPWRAGDASVATARSSEANCRGSLSPLHHRRPRIRRLVVGSPAAACRVAATTRQPQVFACPAAGPAPTESRPQGLGRSTHAASDSSAGRDQRSGTSRRARPAERGVRRGLLDRSDVVSAIAAPRRGGRRRSARRCRGSPLQRSRRSGDGASVTKYNVMAPRSPVVALQCALYPAGSRTDLTRVQHSFSHLDH